mgnify:CR=1 FL=1
MRVRPASIAAVLLAICMLGACGSPDTPSPTSAAAGGKTTPQNETNQEKNTRNDTCTDSQWDATRPETAPRVEWNYQRETLWPYPTSEELGPYLADSDGYRRCYAHSPSGAVLAAANIAAMMTDPTLMTNSDSVGKLFGRGSRYEEIREKLRSETLSSKTNSGVRSELYGFRILESNETTAIIDLGYQASADGRGLNLSIVYNLVRDNGDWKLQSEPTSPISSSALSSFVNYTPWREA